MVMVFFAGYAVGVASLADSEWTRLEAYGELTECKRDDKGKLAEGELA